MTELIIKGGLVLWPILICSVVAIGIFFDRLFHLHRSQIKQSDFLSGIFTIMNRGNRAEAVTICNQTPGPVAHIVRTALLHVDDNSDEMLNILHRTGLEEIPRLEKNLGGLLTIAHITPMLGLLGTLLGLFELFLIMEQSAPLVHIGQLANGFWKALLTSIFGLCISIPSLVGYHFLLSKIEKITINMEYAVNEIHHFLIHEWHQKESNNGN